MNADEENLNSVEIFVPSRNKSCHLSDMKMTRSLHSLNTVLVGSHIKNFTHLACGGNGGDEKGKSCESLKSGNWTKTKFLKPTSLPDSGFVDHIGFSFQVKTKGSRQH